jgi:hypothetical protein
VTPLRPERLTGRIQARKIAANKLIGLDPGDESMRWDIENEFDAEESGWAERVHVSIPRIEEDEMVLLRRLEMKLDRGTREDEGKGVGGDSGADGTAGTGGDEVATEEEERGLVGPSQWERGRNDD